MKKGHLDGDIGDVREEGSSGCDVGGGGEEGSSGWSCSFMPSPALPVPNTLDLILSSILSMLQPTAYILFCREFKKKTSKQRGQGGS